MSDVKNLTLRLPAPLLARVKAIAKTEKRSANNMIELVLTQFVGHHGEAEAAWPDAGDDEPARVA